MSLSLSQESALNLTLQGSTGTFRIGAVNSSQNSLEVRFLLTHVGLNLHVSQNETLLRHLAPVRETYDFEDLEFDEIMQRDIDDARVSHDLIPYLLDEAVADLIKLFPPVVIVLLPTKIRENKPESLYPPVHEGVVKEEEQGDHGLHIIRSGIVGQEVFQFEQPILDGKCLEHDLVKLKINTNRMRMVIVDGQHRAMALLALFRNLKDDWGHERRAPFKHYYSEWTSNFIQKFTIEQINLPLMICTVPGLNEDYTGEYNLKKAAREVFLTLNKTAKKVSDSRNRLLDDNDLVAYFLRQCLSIVKKRSRDAQSPGSLLIPNVELDQAGNRVAIQSPIAITGVNHLYYLIEHVLLDDRTTIRGVKKRVGSFSTRKNLATYNTLNRLDAFNLLGSDAVSTIQRDRFQTKQASALADIFHEKYGQYIIETYDKFGPFDCHNRACLELSTSLNKHSDSRLKSILLDGQGVGRVFEDHRQRLKTKLKNDEFSTDVPQINAISDDLAHTAESRDNAIRDFRKSRAASYLGGMSGKGRVIGKNNAVEATVLSWINTMYRDVYSTVAFQTAIVGGFIREIEVGGKLLDAHPVSINVDEAFAEYIIQLNEFFIPRTLARLKRLIQVFTGIISGDEPKDWKINPSKNTFRSVVYRGEMAPDQWPAYRAVLLELWNPSQDPIRKQVESEREQCREQVFASLYRAYKVDFCREHLKAEESLDKTELQTIFDSTYAAFSGLLNNLDGSNLPNASAMRELITKAPDANEESH
jgi:hypothetical protein